MEQLRKIVVAVLLAVWTFPAVSGAAPSRDEARLPSAVTDTSATRSGSSAAQQAPASSEAKSLAQREQQTPDLQDFRGGGVSIYVGSGALLVVIIILLIILL
jgi:hypothetical protein